MATLTNPPYSVILACGLVLAAQACQSEAIKANQEMVERQQQQIEAMQREIASLKAQRTYPTPPPPPGTCDKAVMAQATRQGGQKYAAGDFEKALGYYQDALAACPGDARAELNLARAYDALKDRDQAILHYQRAASTADPSEQSVRDEARAALDHLGFAP
jgi:tetratricopeptide (TPR) repeat protein